MSLVVTGCQIKASIISIVELVFKVFELLIFSAWLRFIESTRLSNVDGFPIRLSLRSYHLAKFVSSLIAL